MAKYEESDKNGHSEGPAGYNGFSKPSAHDLSVPVKKHPQHGIPQSGGSGKDSSIDGPGCEGMYHK
jgi:hypothetical protein